MLLRRLGRANASSLGKNHRHIAQNSPFPSRSRRRSRATAAAMAKSKNHTSHNQSNKAHKNGAQAEGLTLPWPGHAAPARCTPPSAR